MNHLASIGPAGNRGLARKEPRPGMPPGGQAGCHDLAARAASSWQPARPGTGQAQVACRVAVQPGRRLARVSRITEPDRPERIQQAMQRTAGDSHPAARGARPSASSPRLTGDGRNRRSGSRPAEAARCHLARAGYIRTARPRPRRGPAGGEQGEQVRRPQERHISGKHGHAVGTDPGDTAAQACHGPAAGRILADEVEPAAAPGAAASTWPGRADDNYVTGASLDGGRDDGGQERTGADYQPWLVRPAEPQAPAPGQHDGGQPGYTGGPLGIGRHRSGSRQPPMADMGRAGCRKPGSLMPWPGSLLATADSHSSASSLVGRTGAHRRAQVAFRPGEQAVADLPVSGQPDPVAGAAERPGHRADHADRAGPPSTRNISAGAEPAASRVVRLHR